MAGTPGKNMRSCRALKTAQGTAGGLWLSLGHNRHARQNKCRKANFPAFLSACRRGRVKREGLFLFPGTGRHKSERLSISAGHGGFHANVAADGCVRVGPWARRKARTWARSRAGASISPIMERTTAMMTATAAACICMSPNIEKRLAPRQWCRAFVRYCFY